MTNNNNSTFIKGRVTTAQDRNEGYIREFISYCKMETFDSFRFPSFSDDSEAWKQIYDKLDQAVDNKAFEIVGFDKLIRFTNYLPIQKAQLKCRAPLCMESIALGMMCLSENLERSESAFMESFQNMLMVMLWTWLRRVTDRNSTAMLEDL